MRAPTISPKKCSTVKVDGCEEDKDRDGQKTIPSQATNEDTDRDKQQNLPRQATDEMDTSENLVLGVGRIEVTQAGETVEAYGTGDEIGLEGGIGNFDDTLKEIDPALNAFDGTSNVSPRIKEACLDDVQSGGIIIGKEVGVEATSAVVQEDHGANIDNSTSLGGSLRGWKRLARDKIGVVQLGSSSGGKRHIDDCLEGMADLVPTKRRCASVKNNETVEAEAQPRRAQ